LKMRSPNHAPSRAAGKKASDSPPSRGGMAQAQAPCFDRGWVYPLEKLGFPLGAVADRDIKGRFLFLATVDRRHGIARASFPVDSERFRSAPRTRHPMLGIRRHQPSPVRRASALIRRACHHDPATTDRGSCRSICRNALSNWVLLESHFRQHIRFGFMHTRIRSARIIRDRNRSYCPVVVVGECTSTQERAKPLENRERPQYVSGTTGQEFAPGAYPKPTQRT